MRSFHEEIKNKQLLQEQEFKDVLQTRTQNSDNENAHKLEYVRLNKACFFSNLWKTLRWRYFSPGWPLRDDKAFLVR